MHHSRGLLVSSSGKSVRARVDKNDYESAMPCGETIKTIQERFSGERCNSTIARTRNPTNDELVMPDITYIYITALAFVALFCAAAESPRRYSRSALRNAHLESFDIPSRENVICVANSRLHGDTGRRPRKNRDPRSAGRCNARTIESRAI